MKIRGLAKKEAGRPLFCTRLCGKTQRQSLQRFAKICKFFQYVAFRHITGSLCRGYALPVCLPTYLLSLTLLQRKRPLPAPHTGQTKSSGRSSHFVPGAMPLSGSPTASSYSQPQISHTYFIFLSSFLFYYGIGRLSAGRCSFVHLTDRFKVLCPVLAYRADKVVGQRFAPRRHSRRFCIHSPFWLSFVQALA